MATYKVKNGQNIFDVALHLYGTIEGLFDLLISNPDLSLESELKAGTLLEYHDYFVINPSIVEQLNEQGIIPINGERSVYYKDTAEPLRAIIKIPDNIDFTAFSISGEREMWIDWGDNTPLEHINLTHTDVAVEHYFKDLTEARKIKIYGDFSVLRLNISALDGQLYLTKPMVVDELVCQSNSKLLTSLFLFKNTYSVDLQRMVIDDLSPIYEMSLSELNLLGAEFKSRDILDQYLVNLVENHQNRRACQVWLDTEPSEIGMSAINTIINEEQWNIPEKWVFHINDTIYTANNGENTD